VIFSEKKFDENSQLFRRSHAKFTIEKKIHRNASRYSDDSSSGSDHNICHLGMGLFHIMFISYWYSNAKRSQESIVNIRQIFYSVLQGMFTK
jgi:hypothetical protein